MLPAISPAKFTDERQKRPQQVAEAIKSLIVERALMAGARLPGENELMRHFGMAKGTIREAISILEAQGLVATRTGPRGGTFVKEVAETRAKALLSNYFYFRNVTIADIYQLRRALEPELAATLAGKLSDAQLAQLEATVAEYSKPARDAEEEKSQHIAALRFHAQLANFSGNEMLRFMVRFTSSILSDLTVYRRLYCPPNRDLWEKGKTSQLQLIDALRHGDGEAARRIMAAHMESAQALMEVQESIIDRPLKF